MYANFFGFRELPFNNTPDPRFFYSTPDHEEALASLIYAVKERKGFVLLTGEVGAGKTLVTRMMIRHFGTHIAFANINHAVQGPQDLMESICTEFELRIPPRRSATQLVRTLHDYLLAQFAQNVPVVLVLDEAQNLPVAGFEKLRTIGNLEADDAKLLQIAIVGQPELQDMFRSPELRQLQQRIFRSFHLTALSREATEGYIRHRLAVVSDSEKELFDKAAIQAVYDVSRGLPRIINTVCDNALLSAYSAGRRTIDGPFVESVIAQMMLVDHPNPSSRIAAPAAITAPVYAPAYQKPWQSMPAEGRFGISPAPPGHGWSAPIAGHGSAIESHPPDSWQVAPPSGRSPRGGGQPTTAGPQHGALSAVEGDVRHELAETMRRVNALERRLMVLPHDLAEARAVYAGLEPLVQQVHATIGRAEAASRDMDRRHEQLQSLAGTVKGVVRDLRRLLDRADETAARHHHVQHRARSIHARLVTQSQRSRQLVDELTQVVHRIVSRDPQDAPGARSPSEADAGTDAPPLRLSHASSSQERGSDDIRHILEGSHESLSDLRAFAHSNRDDHSGGDAAHTALPTARLAHQVEDLLRIMETDTTASDAGPVAGASAASA